MGKRQKQTWLVLIINIKIPKLDPFIKKLKSSQDKIANERDKLRELILDYECLAENCDSAIDSIEEAIYKLSELV